jgi:hypothetical protein
MTPKGADLDATDLIEVSTIVGGSYVTKSITGQELIDAIPLPPSGLTIGTTPIASGTVGRVLFEGTGNVLQQSGNFFWDETNARLGIGTSTPTTALDVVGTIKGTYVNTALVYGSGDLDLAVAGGSTGILIKSATRNVLLNTTTDAGFRLDVNGTARVQGNLTATTNLILGSGPNAIGTAQIGRALAVGYLVNASANSLNSFILGGVGNTINQNSFTISSGGYNNTGGNGSVSRYVLVAAPTSIGANSVTNIATINGETLKLNDGTVQGINSIYNAGIITIDLCVMEVSITGNSNVYVGQFAFRFKRYLINGVGFFTDISAVSNLYNSADAALVGTTLTAVANGTNALDIRVTLPATANTANYRMGANVTITKVNHS